MFVALSAGMLAVLTGTGMSHVQQAFADEDECEDNGDDSCNERTQKTELENKCKIVNENENDDRSDDNVNTGSTNDLTCSNSIAGDDGDDGINEPGDILLCHRPPGNEDQEQTLSLSQNAVDMHLANHPADELGACPPDEG
jgi:hypothetical protein